MIQEYLQHYFSISSHEYAKLDMYTRYGKHSRLKYLGTSVIWRVVDHKLIIFDWDDTLVQKRSRKIVKSNSRAVYGARRAIRTLKHNHPKDMLPIVVTARWMSYAGKIREQWMDTDDVIDKYSFIPIFTTPNSKFKTVLFWILNRCSHRDELWKARWMGIFKIFDISCAAAFGDENLVILLTERSN
jgi:hypothetical protein